MFGPFFVEMVSWRNIFSFSISADTANIKDFSQRHSNFSRNHDCISALK